MSWKDYQRHSILFYIAGLRNVLKVFELSKTFGKLWILKRSFGKWTFGWQMGKSQEKLKLNVEFFKMTNYYLYILCYQWSLWQQFWTRQTVDMNWLKQEYVFLYFAYKDDLKLFGKTKVELDSLIKSTTEFSKDIGVQFGTDKCTIAIAIKAGKIVQDDYYILIIKIC